MSNTRSLIVGISSNSSALTPNKMRKGPLVNTHWLYGDMVAMI